MFLNEFSIDFQYPPFPFTASESLPIILSMEDMIKRLMKIERLAHDTYSDAARYFRGNRELVEFLEQLAEDEEGHYHMLSISAEQCEKAPAPPPSISVDRKTNEKIEDIFSKIAQHLADGTLSEETMLENIVHAEFSEFNDLFLYIVSCLKEGADEFKQAVRKIQAHKVHIERFLEDRPSGQALLKSVKEIPSVWTENILIVDDESMVSELIAAILQNEGTIDTAENGLQGLQKIKNKYYKLVISDVDMPAMDGLAFYTSAVDLFPALKDRFLFLTGNPSADRLKFFKKHRLRFLLKPAKLNEIRHEALDLLLLQDSE